MWKHSHFYWNELLTRDIEGAKLFYGDTLGWTYDAMPMADGATYCVCMVGDTPVAGIFDINEAAHEGMPDQWFSYIAVDDLDARVSLAVKKGASLKRPAFDVPGVGRFAIIEDAVGAAIGWTTPTSEN